MDNQNGTIPAFDGGLIGKITEDRIAAAFGREPIEEIKAWWKEATTHDERARIVAYAAAMLHAHTVAMRALSNAVIRCADPEEPAHDRIIRIEALHGWAAEAFFELLLSLHIDDPDDSDGNAHVVRWQALISWAAEAGFPQDAARVLLDEEHSILAHVIRNSGVRAAGAADRRA